MQQNMQSVNWKVPEEQTGKGQPLFPKSFYEQGISNSYWQESADPMGAFRQLCTALEETITAIDQLCILHLVLCVYIIHAAQ